MIHPGLRRLRRAALATTLGLVLLLGAQAGAAPVINEFLATNVGELADEDGDTPDWIELYNPDAEPVNLGNWALTDTATNLTKWRLPATNLPAGGYLVVFASGKDRGVPGAPLHTNFKLDAAGEYLALVAPDGSNVVSEFAPTFRLQFANVSFGPRAATVVPLLDPGAPVRVLVPADDSAGVAWREPGFDDSAWTQGTGGVGYETSPADYAGLLGTDVGAAMFQHQGSCYARFHFDASDPAALSQLGMQVQYDDGFVAWLNGREIARRGAPDSLAWDSLAAADHPDGLAVVPEQFDLTPFADALLPGANVLAVHILNVRLDSSDLMFRVALNASRRVNDAAGSYFTQPTPGAVNVGGVAALGPLLDNVRQFTELPAATNDLVITARVKPSLAPVAGVKLVYRLMYGPEVTIPMFDDGAHGDGSAGDGVFGALIPAGTASAGQMVRYRVAATDNSGRQSRLPLFLDPVDSEEYFGTVMADPRIASVLPVVHLFVQDVGASESFGGTRASIAFLGEFYDNIQIALHGQSSSGFPKKSANLDFNHDHRFRYATNQARVKGLKLLTDYGDKSRTHNTLAYETIAAAGAIGHFAFPVRVQRNAAFHGILDVVEQGDDLWLKRKGLNGEGALYKAYDALDSPYGSEKKTRKEEDRSDLQALIDGLASNRPLAARVAYAYDNLDLAEVVSYFVGLALVSSQDHGHKNFYVYRDTGGSGDWSIFPWDVDLTFGRNWTDSGGYFTDTLYTNNVLNFYNSAEQGKPANRLYTLMFSHPDFRRMYLRRLRTAMEDVLQAPETPADQLRIEARIRGLLDQLDPSEVTKSDADLDEAAWPTWGVKRTTRAEAQRILDVYLPGRRNWLFNSPSALAGGERIPSSQPTNPAVFIDQLEFKPVSGRQTEEYVRLTNAEPFAVDVSGWQLRGEVRYTFRPGTVIPAGHTLHAAHDVAGFRNRAKSPKRGENVFVQGDYHGQLSARGGTLELVDSAGRSVSTITYAGDPTLLQRSLRLSELMFHPDAPPAGSPFTADDFEFLEFKNISTSPLDLTGARFTQGIEYAFTNKVTATLAPGGRALLVKNAAAFVSRHGAGLPILGEFSGNLANSGETLRLEDAIGEVVFEFQYRDDWVAAADGQGYSLELIAPEADLETATSWRASPVLGGTPGRTSWPPVLESYRFDGGTLTVDFLAEGGVVYALEASSTLSPAAWQMQAVAPASTEDATGMLSTSAPAAETTRFCRLRAQ